MSAGGSAARGLGVATVLLTLVLASASAVAGGADDEGVVTARAPVIVDGAGEAVTPNGSLALVSTRTGDSGVLSFTLAADEAVVTILAERVCPSPESDPVSASTCHADRFSGKGEGSRTLDLTDVLVTAAGAVRKDVVIAWTADDRFADGNVEPAAITFAHAGATRGEIQAADDAPERFDESSRTSGYREGDGSGAPPFPAYRSHGDFAYDADGKLRARAEGEWLSVALTGLDVRVQGVTRDGKNVDEVVRAGATREGSGAEAQDWTRHVLVDARAVRSDVTVNEGAARVTGAFEVTAFDGVSLRDAEGRITVAGHEHRFEREDATIAGRLKLVPERVVEGANEDAPRLTLRVASAPVITPATAPPPAPSALPGGAGGVAAAAGAGLLVLGTAYYWPTIRFGLFGLFAPLYSRIHRDDVLEHGTRDEIFQLIQKEPGIHAHEIGARAGIGWGTTVYHLRLLEEHRLVTSKRVGRYRRFYTVAGASPNRKQAYAVLRNETGRDVGAFIVKNPGCAQKDVCDALGISPSLANWHVGKLEEADLVKKVRQGRRVHYYAGPAWNEIDLEVVAPGLAAEGRPLVALKGTGDDPALVGGEN